MKKTYNPRTVNLGGRCIRPTSIKRLVEIIDIEGDYLEIHLKDGKKLIERGLGSAHRVLGFLDDVVCLPSPTESWADKIPVKTIVTKEAKQQTQDAEDVGNFLWGNKK